MKYIFTLQSHINPAYQVSSHLTEAATRGVLKNFVEFTGKHLCQSLFLIKLQAQACNFIKNRI